jgi:hypothetical protein
METIKGKGPPKNFFFPFSLEHKRFLLQALSMAFLYSNNFSSSSSDEEVGRYEPIFFNSHEREEGVQFVELVINVCSMCWL